MDGCIYRTANDKCEYWSDHGKGIVSCCDFDDCEEKKPSNADHIRAMSDEELAEWLKNIWYSCTCGPRDNGNRCADFKDDCNACWLDWLKQEAE